MRVRNALRSLSIARARSSWRRLPASVTCRRGRTTPRGERAGPARARRAGGSNSAADGFDASAPQREVQLLAFNDFHGQITAGKHRRRPPGGQRARARVVSDAARAAFRGETFIVHAGDHVGASPPTSALLQDEPSIAFLNLLGKRCKVEAAEPRPAASVIGTLGNHEFDEGRRRAAAADQGRRSRARAVPDKRYRGATFPYVCANVVDSKTGEPILPPYVVRKVVDGIPIGFIGAVLKETPTIVMHSGVAGVQFLDEADAINAQVAALRKRKGRDDRRADPSGRLADALRRPDARRWRSARAVRSPRSCSASTARSTWWSRATRTRSPTRSCTTPAAEHPGHAGVLGRHGLRRHRAHDRCRRPGDVVEQFVRGRSPRSRDEGPGLHPRCRRSPRWSRRPS